MNILQITALLCITQLAISTAAPSYSNWAGWSNSRTRPAAPVRYQYYPRDTPEEVEEKSPIQQRNGEKQHVMLFVSAA